MRKVFLSFLVVFGLLVYVVLGTNKVSYAQDFNFEKSYQDYVFTQSQYAQALDKYQKSKDAYQKNQTLNLKDSLRQDTYQLVVAREKLLEVYLISVKQRIFENKGLTDEEKQGLMSKIDTEITWVRAQSGKYGSKDSLEDLVNKSKETESRYKTDTSLAIYYGLYYITYGDITNTKNMNLDVFAALKKYIQTKVDEGKLKIDPFDKWFNDIENSDKNISENIDKSKEKINKIYESGYSNPAQSFAAATSIIKNDVIPEVEKINSFNFELLNAIRTQIKLNNQ